MRKSKFWALFHEVWGEDSGLKLGKDYDKKAWIYVQSKVHEYERRKNTSCVDRRLGDRRS